LAVRDHQDPLLAFHNHRRLVATFLSRLQLTVSNHWFCSPGTTPLLPS
jgi:hypothetical protein